VFKRKIYDELLAWKSASKGSTALLVEGARRVGKSTVVEEFAKAEYETYLLIDFTKVTDGFKQTFLDTRSDMDSFFLYLSAEFGADLRERKSLVIFDEVQTFPQAREFVKHLVADGRYDYVETGSLVSIKENVKDILIPSEEESRRMGPMDFEEFLWALGEDALAAMIRRSFGSRQNLPETLHRKADRLWREYMLVGGMPQAVAAYADGRDLMAADRAKRLILGLYRNDIEKHGGLAAKRIKAIFDAIPGQLAKHEKKVVYAQIQEGSRARDFATAFAWLKEAATVNLCTRITDPSVGLALSEDESCVKCYMADTGLLASMAFESGGGIMPEVYRQVLTGSVEVNEGMLMENAVAQQLRANGHPLYFYSKSSTVKEERMEIDFLAVRPYADAAMKPRVSPIEVKSGKRYSPVSLNKFKAKFGKRVGDEYVLHTKPLKVEGGRAFLPLYMSICL
jgi:predicted AAA+ superfamily ATPase